MSDPSEFIASMSTTQPSPQFMPGPPDTVAGLPLITPVFRLMGLDSPKERFLGTAALVGAALHIAKPPFAFDKDGRPIDLNPSQPWKHWGVISSAAGLFVAFFA